MIQIYNYSLHKHPLTVFLTCGAAAAVGGGRGWGGISTSHLSSVVKKSSEEEEITEQTSDRYEDVRGSK